MPESVPSPSGPLLQREHIALYPGSFDPVTYGHLDVIRRGRRIFDKIVVAVGRNPDKNTLFTVDERVQMMSGLIGDLVTAEPAEAPVVVQNFGGLTVDFARSIGATVLIRGIRNLSDLQNEVQQAITNRELGGLETAFIVAGQDFAYTSSSLIRQIAAMGQDLSVLATMVPPSVIESLRKKKSDGHPALRRLAEGLTDS